MTVQEWPLPHGTYSRVARFAPMRKKSAVARQVNWVSIDTPVLIASVFGLSRALDCSGRRSWGDWQRTPEQRKICQALEEVAKQIGAKNIQAG